MCISLTMTRPLSMHTYVQFLHSEQFVFHYVDTPYIFKAQSVKNGRYFTKIFYVSANCRYQAILFVH